jgi:hypothetical protein
VGKVTSRPVPLPHEPVSYAYHYREDALGGLGEWDPINAAQAGATVEWLLARAPGWILAVHFRLANGQTIIVRPKAKARDGSSPKSLATMQERKG